MQSAARDTHAHRAGRDEVPAGSTTSVSIRCETAVDRKKTPDTPRTRRNSGDRRRRSKTHIEKSPRRPWGLGVHTAAVAYNSLPTRDRTSKALERVSQVSYSTSSRLRLPVYNFQVYRPPHLTTPFIRSLSFNSFNSFMHHYCGVYNDYNTIYKTYKPGRCVKPRVHAARSRRRLNAVFPLTSSCRPPSTPISPIPSIVGRTTSTLR